MFLNGWFKSYYYYLPLSIIFKFEHIFLKIWDIHIFFFYLTLDTHTTIIFLFKLKLDFTTMITNKHHEANMYDSIKGHFISIVYD